MLIKGKTVVLLEKIPGELDPFGSPSVTWNAVTVDNVLIIANAGSDSSDNDRVYKKSQTISVGVPKGDTHKWEDGKIIWNGKTYQIEGLPRVGEDNLAPLEWNKTYTAVRYE